jgi:hypothetical protein
MVLKETKKEMVEMAIYMYGSEFVARRTGSTD